MRTLVPCAAALALLSAPAFAHGQSPADDQAQDQRTPGAVALQSALERVCLPLIAGKELDGVAKTSGLRDRDGQWVLTVDGGKRIVVLPPTPANPEVCSLTITYDVNGQAPLLELMNAWALANDLEARRVREATEGPLRDRKTSTWEGEGNGKRTALLFAEERTRDGKPLADGLDQATVMLSVSDAT